MAVATCSPSSLVDLGATLAPFSIQRKKAILIYVLSKYLAALGGTNYTADFGDLVNAAAAWPVMNPAQQFAAMIEIIIATANTHGASISLDETVLTAQATYLENVADQNNLLMFLTCAVGAKL